MRNLGLFPLIGPGAGVEHNEEGEEQSDEVGVGNKPPVVVWGVGGAAGAVRAGFHAHFSIEDLPGGAVPWKLASLMAIMRGFMPSRMEITPSRAISFRR